MHNYDRRWPQLRGRRDDRTLDRDRNLRKRARSMPQMLADDIRRMIVAGEVSPGQTLPSERELLDSYKVSRPTLREALRILEAESLVEIVRGPNGGVVVTAPDPQVVIRQAGVLLQLSGASVGDVYVARAAIEVAAVRTLSLLGHRPSLEPLRRIVEDGNRCVRAEVEGFGVIAGRFHREIVHLTGNITMSFVVDLLATLTDATYTRQVVTLPVGPREAQVKKALRSWEKLIRLIEASDADAAESHWNRHLATVGANLVADQRPLASEMLPGLRAE